VIKKNPRSRPCRNRPDPIETRPDRSDPSSATIASARANTARRPPTHRAREKTIRARRASTARPRRRVVVAQPFANRTPVPRNRARPRRASKTRSHFTSHDPSNPTHTRGFGCRANDRARDAERTSPATDAGRRRDGGFPQIERGQTGARASSQSIARAYLFFSAFLADALTATGAAALTCVAEMTNILSVSFVLEYADARPVRPETETDHRETDHTDGTTSGDSSFHGGLRSTVCSIEFTCHLVRLCMSVNDRVYLCFILLWISIRHQIWYGMVCGSDTNGRFASFGDGFH